MHISTHAQKYIISSTPHTHTHTCRKHILAASLVGFKPISSETKWNLPPMYKHPLTMRITCQHFMYVCMYVSVYVCV